MNKLEDMNKIEDIVIGEVYSKDLIVNEDMWLDFINKLPIGTGPITPMNEHEITEFYKFLYEFDELQREMTRNDSNKTNHIT